MGLIIKNGIRYFGDNSVELTQAQYDALSQAEKLNGTTYYITDGQNITTASAVSYDNTNSGMTATNVQGAIDEVVDDDSYHIGDTISISAFVLPCYSSSTRLDLYIPLPKKIPTGATLTIAGNWRIILTSHTTLASSIILNGAALSTIGTVSAVILEGGISIRVALNSGVVSNWSLGSAYVVSSGSIMIS